MALDDRTILMFKRLIAGSGQPYSRDVARAILAVDEAVTALASKVEKLAAAATSTKKAKEPIEAP